jgi:uncharacterized membrane protein affecting hemolysin expression
MWGLYRSRLAEYVLGPAAGVIVLVTLTYIHGYPARAERLYSHIAFSAVIGALLTLLLRKCRRNRQTRFPVRNLTSNICR